MNDRTTHNIKKVKYNNQFFLKVILNKQSNKKQLKNKDKMTKKG